MSNKPLLYLGDDNIPLNEHYFSKTYNKNNSCYDSILNMVYSLFCYKIK